jgi:hypothetical protein
MNATFPFGLPWPTAFYLVLYVVTLVIHVAFMNYVLAGSAYLAFVSAFTGGAIERQRSPLALMLRDWMPFAVSAAITAGVAPLLFVQILYQEPFYTANLLLFHRWMAILPVLIVGFYLTYVLKAKRIGTWPGAARAAVGVGTLLCFAFVAYSWTENHLLAMRGQAVWSTFYAHGDLMYHDAAIVPRLGIWTCGGFATMAMLVSWQLYRQGDGDPKRAARLALGGLLGAGLCAVWYLRPMGALVFGDAARAYAVVALVGVAMQTTAWVMQYSMATFSGKWLTIASIGCVLTLLGATVVREVIRLDAIDITALARRHADAAERGGLVVFLLFFAINAVLVIWSLFLTRRTGDERDDDRRTDVHAA